MAAVDICNQSLIALGQTTITALTDDNENARRCTSLYETIRNDLLCKHPWNFTIKRSTLVDITKPDVDIWLTDTDYVAVTALVAASVVEFNSVHYTCLIDNTSGGFAADLAAGKWVLTTSWITGTPYAVGNQVYNSGIHYTCVTPHTSAALFTTDLTAVRWVLSVDPEYDYSYAFRIPTDNLRVLSMYGDYEYKIEKDFYTNETSAQIKYIYEVTDTDLFDPAFVTALVTALAGALALAITNNRNIAADMKGEAKEKKLEALGTDAQGGGTPDEPRCDDWINVR